MKQIANYIEQDFNEDYYHYFGNNDHFVRSTLISDNRHFTKEQNKWYRSINVKENEAIDKLGEPNFRIAGYEWCVYWVFDFEGDRYYYQNNEWKGCTIGIWCKKVDPNKNWLFHPDEYTNQRNKKLGKKGLKFVEALSNKLKS